MNFFPPEYDKPVLTGVLGAAEKGWNAVCLSGGTPTSIRTCANGPSPHTAPLCPGMGGGNNSNRLFNNSGDPSGGRLINPGDVSHGL